MFRKRDAFRLIQAIGILLWIALVTPANFEISSSENSTAPSTAVQESNSEDSSIDEIKSLISDQAKSWNEKDIDGFMKGYWKTEKLTFSGGGKTTRGWNATLERYKTKYPPEKMGKLLFDELEVSPLSKSVAMVLGNWNLKFKDESAGGNFTLVLKKIDGQWKIIHDHSSTLEK